MAETQGRCAETIHEECILAEKHLWDLGAGDLYDVELGFEDDVVESYFGLREIKYDGLKFLLNGRSVFQRFVLDQGFNEKGIYTPPDENFIINDIESSMRLGFNGARLHQKVFEPLYLYHCDRLGYMVWGEYPSWGIDFSSLRSYPDVIQEWQRVIDRDFNHPSIITWCPLNEVWGNWAKDGKEPLMEYIEKVYTFTKKHDKTRPCVDVSGGFHSKTTDLFDFHCYEEYDVIKNILNEFEAHDILSVNLLYPKNEERKIAYKKGLPVNISECGGYTFANIKDGVSTVNSGAVESQSAWGYGAGSNGEEDFINRYGRLVTLFFRLSYSILFLNFFVYIFQCAVIGG